jgi:hypothetical protein
VAAARSASPVDNAEARALVPPAVVEDVLTQRAGGRRDYETTLGRSPSL